MWPTLDLYFFSRLGDSQICSWKLLAFPKHLPAAVLSVDVLLLLTTSSPCPADLHGTRLSTKIKTEGPYFSQHQGAFPVGFTHTGGAGGGTSRSVFLSIQRQIGERFIYLLSPSPNLQSWEQEPSGLVISVASGGHWAELSQALGECSHLG